MIDPVEAKIIENARSRIENEWFLAIYMCRDLDIVKEARLDNLAWVLVKYEASREDVKWFFELLDEYIAGQVIQFCPECEEETRCTLLETYRSPGFKAEVYRCETCHQEFEIDSLEGQ